VTLFENWGDYWWPGQYEECLRNILHDTTTGGREIHDPDELERIERRLTTIRAAQLIHDPAHVDQTFTPGHYHALHRWLFQDVYEWAGLPRVVTTLKGDSRFADPEDIDRLLALVHENLGDPARFQRVPRGEFLDALTRTFTGLLMIHPHLEGNGRTSRLYLQQIAARAGYQIEWTQVPAPVLVDATIDAFRLEPDALQHILRNIVHPANRALIRGVITAGNTNFGEHYCLAGPIISAKCRVPELYRFELLGTDRDVARVTEGLPDFWARQHTPSQNEKDIA